MKKFLLTLVVALISLVSCADYTDDFNTINNRLDALEQAVPSIEEQIESINTQLTSLKAIDEAIKAQIAELEKSNNATATEIADLKKKDSALEKSIGDLQKYVDTQIANAKSEAVAAYATVEQYNTIVTQLNALQGSTDKLGEELTAKINAEVKSLTDKIAELEARLKAVEDKVDDLEDKIDLSINFDIEEDAALIAGSSVKVNYTITNSDSECHIATIAQSGWSAVVTKSSDKEGYITVTSPKPLTNSPIIVLVSNSATTIMRTLSFVDGFASVETDSYSVSFEATTLDINVQSNLDYTVEIPSSASSWISVKSVTSRATVRNDVITLTIAENTDASARTATIGFLYEGTIVGSIEVYQQSQTIAKNEIAYTTTDNSVLTLSSVIAFGSRIVSHTYNNGRGLIVCESDITTIGTAFSSCPSLQTIKLPDSVTSIGERAFAYCRSLTSVTIPNSVTSIGEKAFYECSSLTSVTIPDSVTSIGDEAFRSCSSLTSVTIPDSVTAIGDYAFRDCTSLTSVTIPDSITSIENYTFYGCESLTSVTIPDSVTSIGVWAFRYCTSLKSVTIPDSVTSIGEQAFCVCTSLTSVTIPDSVTSIGSGAFARCSSLTSVYCKPTTPPTFGNSALPTDNASLTIYVPTDSVDAYKAASGWTDYAFFIEGYDF